MDPETTARKSVAFLNDARAEPDLRDAAMKRYLRDYLETWIEAEFCLTDWVRREQMEEEVRKVTHLFSQIKGKQPTVYRIYGRLQDPITSPGGDYIPPDPEEEPPEQPTLATDDEFDPAAEDDYAGLVAASARMATLITSPFYNRIRRCVRCGQFYLAKSDRTARKYCSQRCSSFDTAVKSTRERRKRDHEAKLERVRRQIRRFEDLADRTKKRVGKAKGGWQRWVAERSGPDVTQRFVTRAVNKDELTPPNI